jgi:putative tricarboxylic transport membrane protein
MEADVLGMAWHALAMLVEPTRLALLVAGVLIGLAIGSLPGMSGIVGLAILIPFTYHLDAHAAFALLLGMAAVVTTSDFIPAVLFGVPGTVGAAATVIDGHQMARRGEAGRAFGAGFAASLFGGIFGAVVLALAIPVLRPVMLAIGSPELLGFTIFGLSMVATLSGRAPLKGLAVAALGLMIALVGAGAHSGTPRWTFDWLYLWDGVPLVPVTLGLFAVPELADLAIARRRIAGDRPAGISFSSQWQGVRDTLDHWWLVMRCSALGAALGAVPGLGSAVIDWIAYGYAQRTERNPETFGSGDVRGVIAPESSNNAKEGGHLLPTIAFGVPAGASMTLLLGAFLMHGLVPGPEMLGKHLDVTFTIVWSLTLAHVIGAAICVCGAGALSRLAEVRPEILLPIVLPIVFVAAFQGTRGWGDLYMLLLFGAAGWIMKQFGWPRPPLILGIVIGGIFERYLFISTELYGAAWLLRPVVLVVLAVIAWVLYRPLSQIVATIARDLATVRLAQLRLSAGSLVTLAMIALAIAALISSSHWDEAEQLVPRTACWAMLIAAALNLITELFGADRPAAEAAPDDVPDRGPALTPGVVAGRAGGYFGWLAGFVGLVALVGFVPAIALFIVAYMRLAWRETWRSALIAAAATTVFCWVVFDRGLAVPWPPALLGDALPALRDATSLL